MNHLNCDKLLMIQHHQMQTIFHARTHTVHTHASTFISVIISFLSQFALLSIILNVLFSFSANTPTETGRCKPAKKTEIQRKKCENGVKFLHA